MKTPLQILKTTFGYEKFRHEQEKIIQCALNKQDTMVLMPTGGGKSLCYQIPALILDGLTIVISPLIALMKDQVDALRLNGIKAAYLNSTLSAQEQSHVISQVRNNELKMLYLAPERLLGQENRFINFLQGCNVSLFAIDEAHCISQWGHDFRPEYMMLAQLKTAFKNVPVMALTATADKLTRRDILEKLNLHQPQVFISSFNRENIHYHVKPKRNSFDELLDFLEPRKEESGIIYVLSRASTEDLAARLDAEGFSVKPYHAGLERDTREKHQDMFLKDEVNIIVATIAFGMGIDKSNVRYVVHMDLPKNIESYYQETGRAGRDGLKSDALLFYTYADVMKLKSFVEIDGNPEQSKVMLKKLDEMSEYGNLRTCRRKYLLNYFDEEAESECGSCDVCLSDYEKFDGTVIAQKALSAVARLEEKFGATYIIDFLRGSQSAKIWDRHKQLKTYGVGTDISKENWQQYMNDLIHLGYLEKTEGRYPVLQLTEKSNAVLYNNEKVMLVEAITQQKEEAVAAPPYEKDLFIQLKELRNQLAREENVPAYIIFSDATLQELATYLPGTLDELKQISGFGAVKIQRYGEEFLQKVTEYKQENGLESKMDQKRPKRVRKPRKEVTTNTKLESLNLYKKGNSVPEIAKIRNLSPNTIEGHLAHFISESTLTIEQFVSDEKIALISKAIEKHGDVGLSPIKNELGDEVSYGEIRMVLSHLRREKTNTE